MSAGGAKRRSTARLYILYHALWEAIDLVFPPTCAGCGKPGFRWCPTCRANVPAVPGPICAICGTTQLGAGHSVCSDCRQSRPHYHSLRSWSAFDGPVRVALHRLKYRRDLGLGEALTPQLSVYASSLNWPAELVVPVPLSGKRVSERGYNQAALIARPLAMALGLKYDAHAVARVRDTRSQVGLARRERQENVRDAFMARNSRVRGRSILLVDDVATTGSTLSSCAAALCASGARDVFALTVARALPRHGLDTV